tara:strand:+ start:76 stop:705 length:630 start_codon:yes stop_codon:yes gene_type:complete
MKKIGITQRLVKESKFDETRNALDIRWQELLISIDLIPIPIPVNVDLHLYNSFNLDGIILTGGNDLSSQNDNLLSKVRDKHEIECIKYALTNSIPLFGVCRGMQIIAEYYGSSFKKVDNHIAKQHHIKSINKHEYNKYFDNIKYVNSYHKYAINELGDELDLICVCPEDAVIEAIQHKKNKIFGQMWHPERDDPFDLNNSKIISSFFRD